MDANVLSSLAVGGAATLPGLVPFTGDAGAGGTKGGVPAPAAGDGAAGKFLKASGGWAVPAGGGGGGSPAGSDRRVQFNNGGAFGAHESVFVAPEGILDAVAFRSGAWIYAASFIQAAGDVYEKSRSKPMGHWAAYTPTFFRLDVGNGFLTAREMQIGRTTFYELRIIFGTTSTVGLSPVGFTVPRAAVAATNIQSYGRVLCLQGGEFYAGHTWLADATLMYIHINGHPTIGIGTNTPFTWGNGATLFVQGFYEEA